MNRLILLSTLLVLAGCSNSPTAPSTAVPPAASTTVAVVSQKTGLTSSVVVADLDPQPPSCAWRDLVIAKHIALGGAKNDIVTLANQHQVYIVDAYNGYTLVDYPRDWCTR